jgi:hypothetical protein
MPIVIKLLKSKLCIVLSFFTLKDIVYLVNIDIFSGINPVWFGQSWKWTSGMTILGYRDAFFPSQIENNEQEAKAYHKKTRNGQLAQ